MSDVCCPCCGRRLREPAVPLAGLLSVPLPRTGRRIIEELVAAFPRAVPMSRMVDVVYFDDPAGGPASSENCIRVAMIRVRAEIEPLGWTIPRGNIATRDFIGYRLTPIEPARKRGVAA